jgi:hypothetical protein
MEYLKNMNEGNKVIRLENKLAEFLKPVRPNQAFVDSLKGKLAAGPTTFLEQPKRYFGLLVLGLGLVFGALIVWLSKRSK